MEAEKWTSLEHSGPYFAHLHHPYQPHGVSVYYNTRRVQVDPVEEQVLTLWARRILSESAGGCSTSFLTDAVFINNFSTDLVEYLSPSHKGMNDILRWNLDLVVAHLQEQSQGKKQARARDRDGAAAKEREAIKQQYGYATVDGVRQAVANYAVEPMGLFLGRGNNQHRGRIKRLIQPEDVTINVSQSSVPQPIVGEWGAVIHDPSVEWLARWKDNVTGANKYIRLSNSGIHKTRNDQRKWDKARALNTVIGQIRKAYTADAASDCDETRQLATVLYLVDTCGFRIGTERGGETMGASTLLCSSVQQLQGQLLLLDFMGKDSIRYRANILVKPPFLNVIQDRLHQAAPEEPLFHLVSATTVNRYIHSLVGAVLDVKVSSKVFRTRLASATMSAGLVSGVDTEPLERFHSANLTVAQLLNHTRNKTAANVQREAKLKRQLQQITRQISAIEAGQPPATRKSTKSRQKRQDPELVKKRALSRLDRRAVKARAGIERAQETVSCSTSLQNYIDPRIVVAYSRQQSLPLKRFYTPTLLSRFEWAQDTQPDWNY